MALDILELRKLCIPKNIRITLHAAKRLEQRRIFLKDVIACIMNGEIIEQYPDDYPYPSCLILGMSIEDKYLHVVIGNHESDLFLITAYFPSFDKWESDFKTRKEQTQSVISTEHWKICLIIVLPSESMRSLMQERSALAVSETGIVQ